MKHYFIENQDKNFWCKSPFGYWSNFEFSLKDRFEGKILVVYPLFILMHISRVQCKLKEVVE